MYRRRKKNNNKLIAMIICLLVFLVILIAAYFIFKDDGSAEPVDNNQDNITVSSKSEISSSKSEISSSNSASSAAKEAEINRLKAEIYAIDNKLNDEFLRLINTDNRLSESYVPKLKDYSELFKVDERIYDSLINMLNDANKAGYYPVVQSAYRSAATQKYLYNRKIGHIQNDYGYDYDLAAIEAAKIVAIPGTSEHQYGMSLDIADGGSLESERVEKLGLNKWMRAHCAEYGFILRYPEGKEDITKIIYEAWHFRYVGPEYAKEINDMNFCLEEYIDYLKNQKSSLEKSLAELE